MRSAKKKIFGKVPALLMALAMMAALLPQAPVEAASSGVPTADGTYSVYGTMKTPQGKASMSDGSICHYVKLTVKDGTYRLTMNFKGLTYIGQRGYLKNLKYYKTGYTTDSYGNPQGTLAAVTVESYQKYTDGSLVKDTFGTDYPDTVSFGLIPEALEDGKVPLQVYVPVMEAISKGAGTQNVVLNLDWGTVKTASVNDSIFSQGDVVDEKAAELTKGQAYTSGGSTYKALSTDTVSLVKAAEKKNVTVPATVTVGGVKAKVTTIGDKAFASAKKKVVSVTIGANVTSIGAKAFANCKKLKSVTIGKSVKTIGKQAFAGCKKLKNVTVKSTKLTKVGANAFKGIHKKAVIKVPKKQKKKYTKLFKNKGQKKTVKVK